MSYRIEQEPKGTQAIVIEGFENGIASSPHKGIANMQGVNIATESGEAMCSFNRIAQNQVGTSGTLTQVNTNTVSVSGITLKVGQIITITDAGTTGLLSDTSGTVSILAVGGGGGGGSNKGGGGGAGAYVVNTALTITPTSYAITIGAGGAGGTSANRGSNGGGTTIGALVTAIGGGGGGSVNTANGLSGGSGGGAYNSTGVAGSGTAGEGRAGGIGFNNQTSGGGGGASAVGSNAPDGTHGGAGGAGTANSISGSSVTYAGGGGGTPDSGVGNGGAGGAGGGGAGNSNGAGVAGTANTGGGGGGGSNGSNQGGAGGSGIVIISYPTVSMTATGGTITTSGSNTIHTFTTAGTFTISNIVLPNPNYYYLSTGKIYNGSLPPSTPDSATATTGILSGTATFSITYPLGQPIQSATESYYRTLSSTLYYRYYILDSLGNIWCHDTYTLVNWDTPQWFFAGTGGAGCSGLAVYNGWLTIANSYTNIYWKPTMLLGSAFYDSVTSTTTNTNTGNRIRFYTNYNHVMLNGNQGKLYGTDGRYLTSLFANTSLTSGAANIQSYASYTTAALGADLITNGTFAGSATGWSLGTGWTYSANTAVKSAAGTGDLSQTIPNMIAGRYYAVTFTVSSMTAGSFSVTINSGTGALITADGTYTKGIMAHISGADYGLVTTLDLNFEPTDTTARFTIDNVSMKLIGESSMTSLINGSAPTVGNISPKAVTAIQRIPVSFSSDGTLPTAVVSSSLRYMEFRSYSQITFFNELTGDNAIDMSAGASGLQYFNTFTPQRGDFYTYSSQRLNLPYYETSTCLSEIGNTVIVGGITNQIYPWDQVSTLPGDIIFLPETGAKKIITVNNTAYIFAGNKGNIYISNGSSTAGSLKVPDYCAGIAGSPSTYIEPYFTWGDAVYCRGRVYFSILDQTSIKTGNCGGIWSFVPTQNFFVGQDTGQAPRIDNQNSYGTYNGIATVLIGNQEQNAISPQFWSGWYSSISSPTYGIDYTDVIPEEATIIESDLIPTGTSLDQKTFSQIEYKLSSDLVSGESILIKYRQNSTDAWVSVGTAEVEGPTELSGILPVNFQKGQWLQLQATLVPIPSTASSFCRLKELRIR